MIILRFSIGELTLLGSAYTSRRSSRQLSCEAARGTYQHLPCVCRLGTRIRYDTRAQAVLKCFPE